MLSIICAVAHNNAIGYQNKLLYHLSDDLKRFKSLTTGHTVIMGRKTFESLPKGALPNRRNIVLSRQKNFQAPRAEIFASLPEALAHCREDESVFIIGGASVYEEAFPLADELRLTHIHATPPRADVFFPDFDLKEWKCVCAESHEADDRNPQAYEFKDYIRKK